MLTTLLHAGTEHPDVAWIAVASVVSAVVAVGLGVYSDRCRELGRALVPTSAR